jgi:fatty acid desaturase
MDGPPSDEPEQRRRRPLIERIGLAAVAAVLAVLFGGVGMAAWIGGEGFLAVMGAVGCLMTAWVGGLTLFRG